MALPAIGAAIAGIGIGGTAGAVAGTALGIGGSILSARASRKAAEQQYQNNMAAYDAQQRAELEADRRNREGVMTLLQRPFESNVLTPLSQRYALGGINEEARGLADQIMAKQAEIDESTDESTINRLRGELDALNAEKVRVEFEALEGLRDQYAPISEAGLSTARGIFDGGILDERMAAYQPLQDVRSQFAGVRDRYIPQLEAAEQQLFDPSQYENLYDMRRQAVLAGESPETARLRLEATDSQYLDPFLEQRLQGAEMVRANAQRNLNEQINQMGAGRTYGGSSTAVNAMRARASLDAADRYSNALQAAQSQNLADQERWRQSRVQANMQNEADRLNIARALAGTDVQNESQRLDAEKIAQQNIINSLTRRQASDTQTLGEQFDTENERRQMKLDDINLRLGNINLGEQLTGSAQQMLSQPERAMQALQGQRMQGMSMYRIGPGQYQAPTVPVKQAQVNNTLGTVLSTIGGGLTQNAMQTGLHNNQMALLNQSHKNKVDLQNQYLDRVYGPAQSSAPPMGNFPGFNRSGQAMTFSSPQEFTLQGAGLLGGGLPKQQVFDNQAAINSLNNLK